MYMCVYKVPAANDSQVFLYGVLKSAINAGMFAITQQGLFGNSESLRPCVTYLLRNTDQGFLGT